MNYEKYSEAIIACRFCFMCRHLSPISNVTYSESDNPRVRAAMIYGLKHHPEMIKDEDFIKTIFRADLSACCRYHCVDHYDEAGLNIAMRQDIVEAGLAPRYVSDLADEFIKKADPEITGKAAVLYYIDDVAAETPEIAQAFDKIAKKANVDYMTVKGGCICKALKVLGYAKEAKEKAEKFAAVLNATPAKTIVVSNPAAYDALVNDVTEYGIKLKAKVVHISEWIASLKLAFPAAGRKLYYIESDFLKNYNNNYKFPREVLAQMNAEVVPFGTNNEESYTCGEGALHLDKMWNDIAVKWAKYVEERADNLDADLFIVASPYTRMMLTNNTEMNVLTLEEYAATTI